MKKLIELLFLSGGLMGWKCAAYFFLALVSAALYAKLNPDYGFIEHNAYLLVPVILTLMAGFSLGISYWFEYGKNATR